MSVVDGSMAGPAVEEIVYRSSFLKWDVRATVRTHPRPMLPGADPHGHGDQVYFPAKLVPAAGHPRVRALSVDTQHALLVHRLHTYLDFTAELEHSAVMPVAAAIARRRSGFDLPDSMLADAHKICTDEAWHAQFSDDLQQQVAQATGIAPLRTGVPRFLQELAAAQRGLPSGSRFLVLIFFTVVSETLISAILTGIPSDPSVVPAVRRTVADHAEDEGRHHAYFSRLLDWTWPQLTRAERQLVGALLPRFIHAFLTPDYPAIASALRSCGVSPADTAEIISESYPDAQVHADVEQAARATLRHMERVGVLDDDLIADSFRSAGLWR